MRGDNGRKPCKETRIVYCNCDTIACLMDAQRLIAAAIAYAKESNRIAERTDARTPVPSK